MLTNGSRIMRRINNPVSRAVVGNIVNRNFSFSFVGYALDFWPKSHANTIINVCPQGELMVVERFGKLHNIQQPGLFFCLPLVDQIRFRVDVRRCFLCYLSGDFLCLLFNLSFVDERAGDGYYSSICNHER